MHALSLGTRKAVVLAALLASVFTVLLFVPAAFAQMPGDGEYECGIDGCEEEPEPTNPRSPDRGDGSGSGGGGNPGGGGNSGGGGGGSGADAGPRLGPDASVSDAGSGAGGGSDSAASSAPSSGDDPSRGGERPADKKASDKLDGRSLGELLSGGTERVASTKPAASTDAGTRAAKAVSEDGGGAGLLWLLLALGAITAVAAGGVAVRRRQAQQSLGG